MQRLPINENSQGSSLGFLLVGHGTRSRSGQAQLRSVFHDFEAEMAPAACELAFLELAEPDIATGVRRLAERGVMRLVTVPVLLFSAGHAQRDIPHATHEAAQAFNVEVAGQSKALECHPALLRLSAQRFREAICDPAKPAGIGLPGEPWPGQLSEGMQSEEGATSQLAGYAQPVESSELSCIARCGHQRCNQVGLVMVGRGSSSTSATEQMRRLTRLRVRQTPVAWYSTAFLHAQSPTVVEALDALAAMELPWAVVQPHLFFDGELLANLRQEVARRQQAQPEKIWKITEPLGTDIALSRTLAEIARQTSLEPQLQ
jgi:sirohydrochlorin ferrochelatase